MENPLFRIGLEIPVSPSRLCSNTFSHGGSRKKRRRRKRKTKRRKKKTKRKRRKKTKKSRRRRKKRTRRRKKRYKKGNQYGGVGRKIDIDNGIVTYQTLGDCIKELIEASYDIYKELIDINQQTTIVCGGQSPAYYCLAMMNFKIFNPDLVNIVILPHSKGGKKSENQLKENIDYCIRLTEKTIELHEKVVIIDGVHSGTGILALESALKYCFPNVGVTKIAINAHIDYAQIEVDKEIILPCEPKFSDVYPRLVNSFLPIEFSDSSKFITDFNLENNPIAEMIIDVAQNYPEIKAEDTDWYKLNNEITEEISIKKAIQEEKEAVQKIQQEGVFKPIVLENPKRYKCPECRTVSGTSLQLDHYSDCSNKSKETAVGRALTHTGNMFLRIKR